MKKAFLVIGLLFFVNSFCVAQESGNRIYGNQGYVNNLRKPNTNTGNLASGPFRYYSIESSVLLNIKPDAFVVVFGFDRLGSTSESSNQQINAVFDDFAKALSSLGISKDDIFIDFITQTTTVVDQTSRAFQTKKTIAIRYKDRNLFEKIVTLAASKSIFDLIKVDYIVSDFEKVRARLFEEASQMIKSKHEKYTKTFGITLVPKSLAMEKYDAFYPGERYVSYQRSFYYEPINSDSFDKVLSPLGIEPVVQYTLYLKMDYDTEVPKG